MSINSANKDEAIEKLIIEHIPRDALMACEDAYYTGDKKGRQHSAIFLNGHKPSAAGQNKHFFINESFYEALEVHGAKPTPLRGTRLVIGSFGIFNIARLNVPGHKWVNLRRSSTRKQLAELNNHIERKYVQGDLFEATQGIAEATIFIVGVMDGVDANGIAQLTQVLVALPSPNLKSWLYLKPVANLLSLYDQYDPIEQPDNAVPTLKSVTKKLTGDDQGN